MLILRGLALIVRFACELAMLWALALGGRALGGGASSWILAVAAPLGAAIVWGLFVAPKARHPVPIAVRLVIEAVLFGAGSAALALTAHPTAAAALGTASFVTSIVNALTAPSARAPSSR